MTFFLERQRLAGLQLFQHVVHAGQRQGFVRGLLALAVRVELLGEVADAGGLFGSGGGEGELLEASRFDVDRSIFQGTTGRQRPSDMRVRRQHAKVESVAQSDAHQLVVRRNLGGKKLESAVFGGFDGRDVARQAYER